jgi:hypothetical protein
MFPHQFLTLEKIGFARNPAELGLYHREVKGRTIILGLYVDDILLASNDQQLLQETKNLLMNTYKMKDLGKVEKFLWLNIHQDSDHTVKLSLQDYISKLTEDLDMRNATRESIPATVGVASTGHEIEQSETTDQTQYRSIVGKLLFAANVVRYDISYIVGVLSRNLQNPRKIHLHAAKKVVRYLKSTENFTITYRRSRLPLQGFTDADYANDLSTRRSTTGFMFKMAGGPISWRSKLQVTVALSTTEAEFMAITEAVKDGLWLKQVFKGLGTNMCNDGLAHTFQQVSPNQPNRASYHIFKNSIRVLNDSASLQQ